MRRLSRLVEDMFTLTRADVAPLPLEVERLYLDELVDGCVREARLLDAGKGVELGLDAARRTSKRSATSAACARCS